MGSREDVLLLQIFEIQVDATHTNREESDVLSETLNG